MQYVVRPFPRAVKAEPKIEAVTAGPIASTPLKCDPVADLERVLQATYLTSDAHSLWFAQPNLKVFTERAIALTTLAWPRPGDPCVSAIAHAVEEGVRGVREGLNKGEDGYQSIMHNYLRALSTVAAAVSGTHAIGCKSGRQMDEYDTNTWNFLAWANSGKFDEIRFVPREEPNEHMVRGTYWQFISRISDVRTFGRLAPPPL